MSRPACSAYRWLRFSVVNSFVPLCCWALCCCAQALANAPSQASPAVPAPTQQLGPVAELSLTAAGAQGSPAPLRGQDAQSQLVVTAKYAGGQERDLTRAVKYTTAPEGIVSIDGTGLVVPLSDGKTTVTATEASGKTATVTLTVEHYKNSPAINFPNQITPLFTKYGCNGGGCHGKSGGQNGFKLSLLGFEPSEDFEHLVKEGRGRRLSPGAPDTSLLLTKAINAVPHGGGARMDRESLEYRVLRRWIVQGMPYGSEKDPVVTRIEVTPDRRTMAAGGEQQLVVTAFYNDGTTADVTRMAQFDSNAADMAEVSRTGLVKTTDLAGDAAIMTRFQGLVAVFRSTVPLGQKVDKLPPSANFIDDLVFAKLKRLGMPPSEVCDDATFIRRATLDVAGRLPTPEESEQFLADKDPSKRDRLIDRLVDSGDYADYFANKWAAILRNRRKSPTYMRGTYGFHAWIRESLYENKPYDQFVRDVLGASGEMSDNPPVAWYREVKEVDQQVEDTAQLFLGLRIQCARCHHHPFEAWSQRDYYGFAAFFSQVGRKPGSATDEERVFHKRGAARATNPKTNEVLKPTPLGAPALDLAPERDPRQSLADWMATPDNKFFAPALVNRYWKHFYARGIVDPEDDLRVTNPATNPELLDALSQHFVKSKFDLKDLVRTICKSRTYQLSAEPNQFNGRDKQNFSRYYPKRLNAEVLLDALDSVAASNTSFAGLPAGTRAVQIPDNGVNSYFLTVFGKPEGASACECERSTDASLAQSLHLLNSQEIQGKLAAGTSRPALLAKDAAPLKDRIRKLYITAFSREPSNDELATAEAYINRAEEKNRQQAFEDVLWALLNTKEFLFNH
ncbi:MAG: DUF1549 domain-containing protein [Planctomycetales bacterium]|nr:DUF1549 domain-containing protein [Planctomycetales bacterium]